MSAPPVRPLVWRSHDGWPAVADTPFGRIVIGSDSKLRLPWVSGLHKCRSIEDAKKMARADYELRVHAALAEDPDR